MTFFVLFSCSLCKSGIREIKKKVLNILMRKKTVYINGVSIFISILYLLYEWRKKLRTNMGAVRPTLSGTGTLNK